MKDEKAISLRVGFKGIDKVSSQDHFSERGWLSKPVQFERPLCKRFGDSIDVKYFSVFI